MAHVKERNAARNATCARAGCDNDSAVGSRGRVLLYCSKQCMHQQQAEDRAALKTHDPYEAQDGVKKCGECQQPKPVNEYHNDKKRKDGLYPWCKDCRRVYMGVQRAKRAELSKQEYNRKRSERLKRELGEAQFSAAQRDRYLKGRYGIGLNGYREMLDKQGGGCAICGLQMDQSPIAGTNSTRKHFAVDHDHACCPGDTSCGACVRGVLCHHCNVAIGSFKDDPEIMRSAIEYVVNARARNDSATIGIAA